MTDCRVILKDMPTTIPGFVREVDGFATVVINARLDHATQCNTYRHELKHLKNDDMHSDLTADQIEQAAHE